MTGSDVFAKLSAGLPSAAVQRTKASETRKGYDTDGYGYAWVCDRLNEVLGVGGWALDEISSNLTPYKTQRGRDMFACTSKVRITLVESGRKTEAHREMWGGHDSMTEADARKGAFTNAFKKCAALFGVGNDAYRGMLDPDNAPKGEDEEPRNAGHALKPVREMTAAEVKAGIERAQRSMPEATYRALVSEAKNAREALEILREAEGG